MIELHCGDCRDVLAGMEAGSVDAICTDPPYGLGFMGRGWDRGVPGVEFWTEALRVAKPGAHLLAFGGTRTFHRLTCAIEDAGWEIRDCLSWLYGSGFPKSLDVSKALDKAAGAERETVGVRSQSGAKFKLTQQTINNGGFNDPDRTEFAITAPATEAARQWQGWGTALKPAWEPIILARKPLVGTVAANVLTHGTGAINVDGCRVGKEQRPIMVRTKTVVSATAMAGESTGATSSGELTDLGRFPANVLLDDSDEVRSAFARQGEGEALRFFYTAKASRGERDQGVQSEAQSAGEVTGGREEGSAGLQSPRAGAGRTSGGRNVHPTVKPLDLMRYLVRLVTPPGGVVLDPFMGSGTTGCAAIEEGFGFSGIELDPSYFAIAEQRIASAQQRERFALPLRSKAPKQKGLI